MKQLYMESKNTTHDIQEGHIHNQRLECQNIFSTEYQILLFCQIPLMLQRHAQGFL